MAEPPKKGADECDGRWEQFSHWLGNGNSSGVKLRRWLTVFGPILAVFLSGAGWAIADLYKETNSNSETIEAQQERIESNTQLIGRTQQVIGEMRETRRQNNEDLFTRLRSIEATLQSIEDHLTGEYPRIPAGNHTEDGAGS